MDLLFYVNGQKLSLIGDPYVVANSYNYQTARFTFSTDWDGLEKHAVFTLGEDSYDIILTSDTIVKSDHLNLTEGSWLVSLFGVDVEGSTLIEQITTDPISLTVYASGSTSGLPFPPYVSPQIAVMLDQTTPQTIVNGVPLLEEGRVIDSANQLVDKKYVDQYALGGSGFAANLYFTTINSDVSGYKKISYTVEPTETELVIAATQAQQLIRTYLFDGPVDITVIDGGIWNGTYRARVASQNGAYLKIETFLRHANGTETTLFSATTDKITNTTYSTIKLQITEPGFQCAATDRIGFRLYAWSALPAGNTIYTIVGDGNASYINTPIALRHNQLRSRDAAACHPASAIAFTPIGTMTATDVQAAIAELYALINP